MARKIVRRLLRVALLGLLLKVAVLVLILVLASGCSHSSSMPLRY